MTAGPAVTRCRVPGAAADGVTDLGAIRRCDAILDLLAGTRRLDRSLARRDPALAVLSVLAADVDGAAARFATSRLSAARLSAARLGTARLGTARSAARPGTARGAARTGGPRRGAAGPRQATVAAIVASALAALVLAVVAAGTTGIVIAGLLTRMARLGTGFPAAPPERGRHAARHRRR